MVVFSIRITGCLFAMVASVALLSACGEAGVTDEHPCQTEHHCIRDSGSVRCENGYTWEEPDNPDNFVCVPIVDVGPGGDGDGDRDVTGGDGDGDVVVGDGDGDGDVFCGADLMNDPHNCGACGHDCLLSACFSGLCQPRKVFEDDNVFFGAQFAYRCSGGNLQTLSPGGEVWDTTATPCGTPIAEGVLQHDANGQVELSGPMTLTRWDGTETVLGNAVSLRWIAGGGVLAHALYPQETGEEGFQLWRRDIDGGPFELLLENQNVDFLAADDNGVLFRYRNEECWGRNLGSFAPGSSNMFIELDMEAGGCADRAVSDVLRAEDTLWVDMYDEGLFRVARGGTQEDLEPLALPADWNIDLEGRAALRGEDLLVADGQQILEFVATGATTGEVVAILPIDVDRMAVYDDILLAAGDDSLYRVVLPAR